MFNSILVPLDGSPLAERALPYALAIAQTGGGRLRLVQAIPPAPIGINAAQFASWSMEQARSYLDGVAEKLDGLVSAIRILDGEAVDVILEELKAADVDLVVMSTHGRSGLGRWVYGSVAAGVLHASQTPVLLVRAWQEVRPPNSLVQAPCVLVPLDGSNLSEVALPVAAAWARQFRGEVALVRCVPRAHNVRAAEPDPGSPAGGSLAVPGVFWEPIPARRWDTGQIVSYSDQEQAALEGEARDYLQRVGQRAGLGPPGPGIFARSGIPAIEIAAVGDEINASLVVMATHGRGGLGRALLGSVADRVLREGHRPLLLVRPPAEL